jgi:hypothetical protein
VELKMKVRQTSKLYHDMLNFENIPVLLQVSTKTIRTLLKQNILTIATLGGVIGDTVQQPKKADLQRSSGKTDVLI